MASKTMTLYIDGRIPIHVDREEFQIIKMTIEDAGAVNDQKAFKKVVQSLMDQEYSAYRAINLCVLARGELNGSREPSC